MIRYDVNFNKAGSTFLIFFFNDDSINDKQLYIFKKLSRRVRRIFGRNEHSTKFALSIVQSIFIN